MSQTSMGAPTMEHGMSSAWIRRTPSAARLRHGAAVFVACLVGVCNLPALVALIAHAKSYFGYESFLALMCFEIVVLAPMPLCIPALLQLLVAMRSRRRIFIELQTDKQRERPSVSGRTASIVLTDCVGARQCKTRAGTCVILPVQRGAENSRVMNVSDEESVAAILVAGGHRRAPLGPFRFAVRMGPATRGGRCKPAIIFTAAFVTLCGASHVWPDVGYLFFLLMLPPVVLALVVLLVVVPWVYLMKEIYSYANLVVDADGIRLGELETTYRRLRSTTLGSEALRIVREAEAGSPPPQEWVIRPLRSRDWQQLEIIKDIIDHGILHAAVGHGEPPGVYRADERTP
jgi:hypothetical protein